MNSNKFVFVIGIDSRQSITNQSIIIHYDKSINPVIMSGILSATPMHTWSWRSHFASHASAASFASRCTPPSPSASCPPVLSLSSFSSACPALPLLARTVWPYHCARKISRLRAATDEAPERSRSVRPPARHALGERRTHGRAYAVHRVCAHAHRRSFGLCASRSRLANLELSSQRPSQARALSGGRFLTAQPVVCV